MSAIKVGPLPNGGECVFSKDIGLFNVRLIQEPGPSFGYAVIYSFDQTRLECLEYDRSEEKEAKAAWMHIQQALVNAQACFKSKLIEVYGH